MRMSDLRYPIGHYNRESSLSPERRGELIEQIASAPFHLREAVKGLSEAQLETPYRPDGWTLRQVVHHLPDSHTNAYVRFKLALTEENPIFKPYAEERWAELPDSKLPVAVSLDLLDHLHSRWVSLLRALPAEAFARTMQHPDEKEPRTLDLTLCIYAWHGAHHVAHITTTRERLGF
jgi:hypothetical protein